MEISATITSSASTHQVSVRTGAATQSLLVPAKATGRGSAVNGGEFLMLALATCYCNDLYREAERLGIPIEGATVEATAEFPGVGLAATSIRYRAVVKSSANVEAVTQLLRETDAVAEVHNTVRSGVPVLLHLQWRRLCHRPLKRGLTHRSADVRQPAGELQRWADVNGAPREHDHRT